MQTRARKDYRMKLKQYKMIVKATLAKVNIIAQDTNINDVNPFSVFQHIKSQRWIHLALEKWQIKPMGRSGYIDKIGKESLS